VLPPAEAGAELPPRLKQVLDRLLVGHPPKRIARELRLSVWTVREHVQRLYKRFDVNCREELMAKFVRQ
jgi:DNA-binding NarL/FixJ family response regulator